MNDSYEKIKIIITQIDQSLEWITKPKHFSEQPITQDYQELLREVESLLVEDNIEPQQLIELETILAEQTQKINDLMTTIKPEDEDKPLENAEDSDAN